jgi:hypothetical protein
MNATRLFGVGDCHGVLFKDRTSARRKLDKIVEPSRACRHLWRMRSPFHSRGKKFSEEIHRERRVMAT